MVINSYEEYNSLLSRMSSERNVISHISLDTHYHPAQNSILCAGVTFLSGETYVVSVAHRDAPLFSYPHGKMTLTAEDVTTLCYVSNTPIPSLEHTPYITQTHNMFDGAANMNKIVPLMVWSSIIKKYNKKLVDVLVQDNTTLYSNAFAFTTRLRTVLSKIELSGLYVNKELLLSYFEDKVQRYFPSNVVYSQYNPYTTTGRPSNRFGNINFSALNKHDGSRDCFISRYDNGSLIQFDFEAYHLRLIADELQTTLPVGSIHTEMAKLYFGTEDITDELYARSKQITFEIIYGMRNETYGFELFEKIHAMRQLYKNQSSIRLPSGVTVQVDSPNPSKLYNYYVQSLETVKTLPKLEKVLDCIKNLNCHLTLYTYDSILLDMERYDQTLIDTIREILEDGNKYPVRVYAGTTYGNIKEVKK